jgi:hypothetical protein
MSDIFKAIKKINPNAKITVRNNDINSIDWLDGTTPISNSDIEAQLPAVDLDIALDGVRIQRNALIAETDYLALSDQTLSAEMSTYRQALRNITNGVTTVEQANNITWPTKP